ncbi:MAG: preprotein translocase subunit SecY [Patescibacteria group bacterium UBA2103]
MFSAFLKKLSRALKDSTLRNRILFILGALLVYRALATIPVPGVDTFALQNFFANNEFLGLLNILSGGGLANLSIMLLGVGPYITSSIIMQLMTVVFPQVKAMQTEEGEVGRAKFVQWSRMLTVPFAVMQGIAFIFLLQSQGIIGALEPLMLVTNILVVAAGSIFLMWIGELMTEYGIGNGISLIIFAGIVASLPTALSQAAFSFTPEQLPAYLGLAFIALVMTFAVVLVTEAERAIPITHAKQLRGKAAEVGASTYLPIRINQAGVIPIIFALSLLLVPQTIANIAITFGAGGFMETLVTVLNNQWVYGGLYFFFVVMFTYFYTAIIFEPKRVAENLQKSGAFIPGVRPGVQTEDFLGKVATRITLPGALFLGLIAIVPIIVQGLTGISTLVIGGTALLIAVSVVLDVVRKVDAQVSLNEY